MGFKGKALGIAAGVAGALFIGYCIYFDRKRRSVADFKKRLHARRHQNCQNEIVENPLPDLNDRKAVEKYFLQELEMGDSMLSQGDFDRGTDHLANASVVCSQPDRLLQLLHATLSSEVFAMLIMKINEIRNKQRKNQESIRTVKSSTINTSNLEATLKTQDTIIDDQLE